MLKKFEAFVAEAISTTNKEPIDHLAHYLHIKGASNIQKVPSGKFVEYKSPKAMGLACQYGDFKYFVWFDFDDSETKLEYKVQDFKTIHKDQALEPEVFTTANEAADYVCGKKFKHKNEKNFQV